MSKIVGPQGKKVAKIYFQKSKQSNSIALNTKFGYIYNFQVQDMHIFSVMSSYSVTQNFAPRVILVFTEISLCTVIIL